LGAIFRWILTAIRDWLNGQIDPQWRAKQEQLQQDAAAHQRKEKVVKEEIAEAEKHEAATEAERVKENERIDAADNLKDVWGFPK
jgi:hypothetical protein